MPIPGMKSDIVVWNGQAGENQGNRVQTLYRAVAKIVNKNIHPYSIIVIYDKDNKGHNKQEKRNPNKE